MEHPSSLRVAARLSTDRVAARWLHAGLVQAPPAMLDAIVEWVVATAAATSIEAVDRQIEAEEVDNRTKLIPKYDEIQRFIDELRASPSWKLYKQIEDHMWHIGGAYQRKLKIKAFQKMTSEKREWLKGKLGEELDGVQRHLDGRRNGMVERLKWSRERQQEYKSFTRPGVGPLSGDEEVTRKFDIDTAGWRYGTEEYLARLNAALAKATRNDITDIEELKIKHPDMADFFDADIRKREQQITTGEFPGWGFIWVKLAAKPVRKELASWSRMEHTIRVVIPIINQSYGLHELENGLPGTVRHELQHFAQSWLAAIAGETMSDMMKGLRAPAGMPGKQYRTPEFKQHEGPGASKADTPQAKALRNKLRQQGVNPKKVNWHDLDDIEFYTELADSIERFKRRWARESKKQGLDAKLKGHAIKFWTGTRSRQDYKQYAEWDGNKYGPFFNWQADKFFMALKSVPGAAAKKRKALGEFVKAVL